MISSMCSSQRPSVFGLVIIRPAVSGPTAARSASRSQLPRASEGMVTTSKPAITAVAGLVPWAESGTRILVRPVSPSLWW